MSAEDSGELASRPTRTLQLPDQMAIEVEVQPMTVTVVVDLALDLSARNGLTAYIT